MLGWFSSSAVPAGWFQETAEPLGWFNDQLLGATGVSLAASGTLSINGSAVLSVALTAPSFVGFASAAGGTGGISIDFASTGRLSGDLLLIFRGTANQPAGGIVPPTGFTELSSSPQGIGTAGTAGAVGVNVYWKISDGTETSVSLGDSGDVNIAQAGVYRGVDQSAPISAATGGTVAAGTTAHSFGGVTTTRNNSLVVWALASDKDANTSTWSGHSTSGLIGGAERLDGGTAAGTGVGISYYEAQKEVAGASGNLSATASTSDAIAWASFAIQPAAASSGVSATATGSLTISGTSAATVAVKASASGTLALAGSSSTGASASVAASGSLPLGGSIAATVSSADAFPGPISTTTYIQASSLTNWNPFSDVEIPAHSAALFVMATDGSPTISAAGSDWSKPLGQASHPSGFLTVTAFLAQNLTGAPITRSLSLSLSVQETAAGILHIIPASAPNRMLNVSGATSTVATGQPNPPPLDLGQSRNAIWLAVAAVEGTAGPTAPPAEYSDMVSRPANMNNGGHVGIYTARRQRAAQNEDPGAFSGAGANQMAQTLAVWETAIGFGATASGTLPLSGSATLTRNGGANNAVVSGSLGLSGQATGTVRVSVASTGTLALAGSAAGTLSTTLSVTGTGAGSISFTLASEAVAAAKAFQGSGTLPLSGSAKLVFGAVAEGVLPLGGTGTIGTPETILGTGTGVLSFALSSSAAAVAKLAASGQLPLAGGAQLFVGAGRPLIAVGTLPLGGAAATAARVRASATGTLPLAGSADAEGPVRLATAGTLALAGSAATQARVRAQSAQGVLPLRGSGQAFWGKPSIEFGGQAAAIIRTRARAFGTIGFFAPAPLPQGQFNRHPGMLKGSSVYVKDAA